MPNPNPLVAEISDKNGQVYDIAAKRFSGNRTVELTGDVTGTESGWNGSGQLTVATSIGSKKVKTSMIDDKAVGTSQIDDGAVGFDQIDSNVYTNTVEENNTKLVTSGGVNAAIQNAILNRGIDYGPKTVDEINALSNIPTGSSVHVSALGSGDARVVNDGWEDGQHGSIQVRVGEDLTYYASGNDHGWYSNDGEFKLKQQAYSASGLGTLKTITSLSQDENGVISATASDIQSASTSQAGVVQLNDATNSTSTTQAATANAVKKAYDHVDTAIAALDAEKTSTDGTNVQVKVTEVDGKVTAVNITTDNTENKNNKVTSWSSTTTDTHYPSEKLVKDSLDGKADKVSGATSGNFAGLDANGNLTDSGSKASDFATAAQGSKADSAVQGVKLDGASSALTPDANKVVTIPNAAPTGTGATNGLMTAADKAKLNGITSGANKVEASNTNGNIKIDGTETNVYTHPSAGPSSATSVGDTTNQTPAFGGTFKAISQTVNTDGHTTATAEHTVTLPTDGKDLTSTVSTENNYTNPGSTATALKTLFGKIWNFIGRLRTSWQTTPDDTHFPSEKLVKDSLDLKAPLASPALTGTPTAPTAAAGTNTTQIATTAFVQGEIAFDILSTTGGFGTTKLLKLFEVARSATTGYGTYVYIVRYSMANNATIDSNGSGTIELRIRTRGTSEPLVSLILKEDAGKKTNSIIPSLKYYKKSVNGGLNIVVAVNAGSTNYEGLGYKLDKAFSNGGSNLQSEVTMAARDTVFDPGQDYTEITDAILHYNEVYNEGVAVGSTSVPVYVGETGKVIACTDDFVHDAEIAKMVQVETAGTAAGSSLRPVYVNSSGEVKACDGTVDWKRQYNGYKDVSFSTETLATFMSAASVTGSFANKLFGADFDSSELTINAIGLVDFGSSGLQAAIGALSRYATFRFVANRQRGYVDFVSIDANTPAKKTKTIRFAIDRYGAMSRQVYLVTSEDVATTTDAGIVQFMTSAETTSMIAAAKAAAS